jgi:hypothetical protein
MRPLLAIAAIAVAAAGFAPPARAEIQVVPESRHHLFQPYAFFLEPQNDLLWRTPTRGWGEVGGVFPLFEATDWRWTPQLLIHGTANAAYVIDTSKLMLMTQTVDARAGLFIDLSLADDTRLEIGWTHESGHVSDDIPDSTLIGPNLGNEIISFRLLHDIEDHFRLGGTLKPVAGATPKLKVFGADQFAEWFPWGQSDPHTHSFYVAMSLQETGVDHIVPGFQAQVGLLWGTHFRRPHHMSLRLVAGYYTGLDPRLKFAQYLLATMQFGYAGVMFDF